MQGLPGLFQRDERIYCSEDISESVLTREDIELKATLSTSDEQPGFTIFFTCKATFDSATIGIFKN